MKTNVRKHLLVNGAILRTDFLFAICLAGIALHPQLGWAQSALDNDLGYSNIKDFDPRKIDCSVDGLFKLIEGSFGAMLTVTAGLGAIISAAMGAYRAAVSMLVVAVGSFILRALVSLFFGTFAEC
ncbi:MAG: hypothetical protein U0136_21115 [Bdellovibrionota bacterium]